MWEVFLTLIIQKTCSGNLVHCTKRSFLTFTQAYTRYHGKLPKIKKEKTIIKVFSRQNYIFGGFLSAKRVANLSSKKAFVLRVLKFWRATEE